MSDNVRLPKRPRGRPKGTGKRDEPILREIADRLLAEPTLKPTTVIKRIVEDENPSDIRRFQAKWKKDGPMFLDEARQLQDIEQYDPLRHADAPIGSFARANQNDPISWESMSRGGWHNVQGLAGGEWIIRRDLWGVISTEELLEQCAAYFEQIGFGVPAGGPLGSMF